MQLSFAAQGAKADVLAAIRAQASKETARYAKECAEHQVHVADEKGTGKPLHEARPLPNTTSVALLEAAIAQATEQLAHVGDTDACSVAFHLTVHRAGPE